MQDKSTRYDFLDGMRALAALWVMLGHAHLFTFGWSSHASWLARPLNILLYLHLGVNVFLVLSGFCLALSVARHGGRLTTGLRGYVLARAWRILPPYLAALLLILAVNAVLPLLAWARNGVGLTAELPWQMIAANVLLLQDVFPHLNRINGPFWSIAIEWHLYFLFPLMVWVLRRWGASVLLVAALTLVVGMTWWNARHPYLWEAGRMTLPQPPYYLLLFCFGILSAWWVHGPRAANACRRCLPVWVLVAAGLLLCLAALCEYRIEGPDSLPRFEEHLPLIDPLTGFVTAALLAGLSLLAPTHPLRRLLSTRALVALGGFSYSLYLLHVPVQAILTQAITWLLPQLPVHLAFVLQASLGSAVTIVAARYFAQAFENRAWLHVMLDKWRGGRATAQDRAGR